MEEHTRHLFILEGTMLTLLTSETPVPRRNSPTSRNSQDLHGDSGRQGEESDVVHLEANMRSRPFPLLPVFSVASLFVLGGFSLLLSWLLGQQLEEELLNRDTLITTSTVQSEVVEYLGDRPFSAVYEDPETLKSVLHAVMVLPGSHGVEVIHPDGRIGWSSVAEEVGEVKESRALQTALQGKPAIQHEDVDEESFPHADVRYASALYIPIPRGQGVIGVIELHRYNVRLKKQVDSLQQAVWTYSLGFGAVLYVTLLLIVFPASRILHRQHVGLLESTEHLSQANRELREAQDLLLRQERLAAMGEVSAAVAHGLKNPVAGLRAALQVLAMPSMTAEERQETIASLIREIDRLTERVAHLLNFVRPFHPEPEPVSLYHLIGKAADSLEWQLREKGIALEIRPDPQLPRISADPSLIEEALLIVLNNAIDASLKEHRIVCSVEAEGGRQILQVQDEGGGIAADRMEHIFEQFYTTRSRGIGLGLALCKKILEAHQGKVELESVEHQGTTVRLILPATPSA
jgi:two-component system sensor histidine kinase HydH